MTVIAWDGRTVAADSLGVVGHGVRSRLASAKIELRDGVVFGTTGRMGPLRDAWIAWWQAGADAANVPAQGGAAEDCGNFLVFKDGRCFVFSHLIPYACEESAPFAYGSGSEFAIGAMRTDIKAGRSPDATNAVEVAIECDVNCGGPVLTIDLPHASGPAALAFELMRERDACAPSGLIPYATRGPSERRD